jgi:hypothetical protein
MTTITVELLRYPLRMYVRSRAHFEELVREFQLVGVGEEAGETERPVPQRLLELVDKVTKQYAGRVEAIEAVRAEAIERGETSMDLSYELPVEAAAVIGQLRDLLAECDEFCRRGEYLLTLATPPDIVAFREWNIGEILGQIEGAAPTPWPGEL